MAEKFLKQYEVLIIKAKDDLITAKYLWEGFNKHNLELRLEIIFFHFQQCAEKLIKSLLDFNSIKFPHTHDLEDLISLIYEQNIKIIGNIDFLIPLSGYAVEGRYAIIHDDLDDANKYIKILDELLQHVTHTIQKDTS